MGDDVSVPYLGGEYRQFEAHLKLESRELSVTPDRTILGFVKLIDRLRLASEMGSSSVSRIQHRDPGGFSAPWVRVAARATDDRSHRRGASHAGGDRLRARLAPLQHVQIVVAKHRSARGVRWIVPDAAISGKGGERRNRTAERRPQRAGSPGPVRKMCVLSSDVPPAAVAGPFVGPHRPEAQDVALSRPKRGFESRWGRYPVR